MSRHRDRHSTPPKRAWRQRYRDPGPIGTGPLDVVFDFLFMGIGDRWRERRRRRKRFKKG